MKKVVFCLGIIACVLVPSGCGDLRANGDFLRLVAKTTPEERAQFLTDLMKAELSLEQSQHEPVYEINLKYAREMEDIVLSDGTERTKAKGLRDMNAREEAELETVLREDQYQVYQEKKKQLREQVEHMK
jgi:hypothetical protein